MSSIIVQEYKVRGGNRLINYYKLSNTIVPPVPPTLPEILSFLAGNSAYGGTDIPIDDLTGNDVVDTYLVSLSPTGADEPGAVWTNTPPTGITV